MNYLEEVKRIKNLTSDLVTDMIVNNQNLIKLVFSLLNIVPNLIKL